MAWSAVYDPAIRDPTTPTFDPTIFDPAISRPSTFDLRPRDLRPLRPVTFATYLVMDFFNQINLLPEEALSMDLDDPEEEVECGEDIYDSDDVSEDEFDEEGLGGNVNRGGPTRIINLPPPPQFEPFRHPAPEHKREERLPNGFDGPNTQPLSFFKLFFTEEVFESLAVNTNAYADMKGAGLVGRRWRKTNAAELMVFIGDARAFILEPKW
ncbi:hypothetical protein P167DRAFT_575291 [Morchella conica CCBAS932]|uniref:PiggyBac transposable element-derived protein domain-containing protein n=1 Tax=Morchella conica CCBAS932 TaxID=1392247 RepID=A0A3N4KT80_9PEZI|nr:hypothetical protein P167DRAFT_575291 [Morchella conica CCBAS932]